MLSFTWASNAFVSNHTLGDDDATKFSRSLPPPSVGRTGSSHEPPGTIRTVVALSRSCLDQCAEGQISRGGRAERCCDAFKQTTSDREHSGSRFADRGPAHAPDKSAERVERLVAVVSRRVGRSIGFGERDQGDGVDFSIVRWCGKVVRVDGGHVAVRSWPVCRKVTRWGFQGVRVGEVAHPGPKKSYLRRCQSTRLDSDSDALLIDRGRIAVLSSDDEEVCERSNHASSASVEILARAPVSSHTGPKWLRVMPRMSQATTAIGPSGEERAGLAISHNDSESDSVVDALQRDLEGVSGPPVLAVNGDVGMSRSFHSPRHVLGSRIELSAEDCTSTVPDGDTQHVVAIPRQKILALSEADRDASTSFPEVSLPLN